jgi:hypothetical protein
MTPEMLLLLLFLFQIKHLLADFVLQTSWMVFDKGRYGHPAGIAHAGIHGLLSAPVLLVAGLPLLPAALLILG